MNNPPNAESTPERAPRVDDINLIPDEYVKSEKNSASGGITSGDIDWDEGPSAGEAAKTAERIVVGQANGPQGNVEPEAPTVRVEPDVIVNTEERYEPDEMEELASGVRSRPAGSAVELPPETKPSSGVVGFQAEPPPSGPSSSRPPSSVVPPSTNRPITVRPDERIENIDAAWGGLHDKAMGLPPYAPAARFGSEGEVVDNPAGIPIGKGDQPVPEGDVDGGAGEEKKAA